MSNGINADDRDKLGEVGHVGAGRVAMALERMMGDGSQLSPPRVGDGARPIGAVEVSLQLSGPIHGEVILNLSTLAVRFLLNRLLASNPEDLGRLGAEDRSVLEEVANIVGCSYLTALSEMTGLSFHPSVPVLRIGGRIEPDPSGLWVASRMKLKDAFDVEILFCLDEDASSAILGALAFAA